MKEHGQRSRRCYADKLSQLREKHQSWTQRLHKALVMMLKEEGYMNIPLATSTARWEASSVRRLSIDKKMNPPFE